MQKHTLKIDDLRRGNYVEYHGKWERIQNIIEDRVTFQGHATYKEVKIEDVKPIVVTSGVLNLAGFYDRYTTNIYSKEYCHYDVRCKLGDEHSTALVDTSYEEDNPQESDIRHLHLWQNYHFFTQKETLEIREPLHGEHIPDVEWSKPEPIPAKVEMMVLMSEKPSLLSEISSLIISNGWRATKSTPSYPNCLHIQISSNISLCTYWLSMEQEDVNPTYILNEDNIDTVRELIIHSTWRTSIRHSIKEGKINTDLEFFTLISKK